MKDELARAIAKDHAITIEAKVRSYSKRADGGINIGLAVHPHGIPSGMREIEIGDRFYVAMFQIDDNEQPTERKVVDTQEDDSTLPVQPAPATLPGRASDKKLAQLAGILSKTPLFHRYLEKICWAVEPGDSGAAAFIRGYCKVESRSQIISDTPAGDAFLALYDQFIRWRDADQYVEA